MKNSWGPSLDYFYVSYESVDTLSGARDIPFGVLFGDAVTSSSYRNIYQHDQLGFTGSAVGLSGCTVWAANVFTAQADEELAAVGFYALAKRNTSYWITVYDTISRSESEASFRDELTSPVWGTVDYFGYHTVTLPTRVPLRRGDDFAIVIKLTTPGTDLPLALEVPIEDYSSEATAGAGEGYVSADGQTFLDLTANKGYEQASICIKGLTVASATGGGGGGGVAGLPPDLVEVTGAQDASLAGLASGSKTAQDRQIQAVQQLGLPLEVKARRTEIVLRLVPAGTFMMGSSSSETERGDGGGPQHQVTLTRGFYCGQCEVTQRQWQQVMDGGNPAHFKSAGDNAPVEQVSWEDCQEFLKKLCQTEGVPKGTYRLLTEAEWEYACRAGTETPFCYGNDLDSTMANFNGNYPYGAGAKGIYRGTTIAVRSFNPNAWGLYDMHGNVCEWCQDWFGTYPSGSVTDPIGDPSGTARAIRGGGWWEVGRNCRSASRYGMGPGGRSGHLGFRLARTIPSYP
ncbi:MAG: SUMF1/EgtB/PvdO family nonheme iron enzyme [Planctomycetes bacterium]|nr:SUMF1/EgtB/PvdO family nonheme iron enzyme [Planctomycetota bacterium]